MIPFRSLAFIIEAPQAGHGTPCLAESLQSQNSRGQRVGAEHFYWEHPERFVQYGTHLFDPGLPETARLSVRWFGYRDPIRRGCDHMDDYFYPYPIGAIVPR